MFDFASVLARTSSTATRQPAIFASLKMMFKLCSMEPVSWLMAIMLS